MRKLLAFIVAALVCTGLRAQYADNVAASLQMSETASELCEHIRFLSSAALEGRGAGTEGEKEAAGYVYDALRDAGIDMLSSPEGDLFGMRQEAGDTLTSRNVIGFIPGYDPKLRDHYIVIGARLDNLPPATVSVNGEIREKIYYGANSNASGLAALVRLARTLNTNRVLLKRSVIIAAFGASSRLCAGSWYFLNRTFPDSANIDAMINLDMLGTGSNGFFAYTCSNEDMNAYVRELSSTLQPVKPELVSAEPFCSDHRSFYASEIPSVLFTTGTFPEYGSDRDVESIIEYDWMERELEYIYNFTVSLAGGAAPNFKTPVGGAHSGDAEVVQYYDCDNPPTFFGSSDPVKFLKKWVYIYLRYPQEAVRQGIQGRVLVDFIIDEKGKVTDVKVIKGVDELLDEEAVRVIQASPDWKPGKVHGRKVKTELSLYVEFRLEKK